MTYMATQSENLGEMRNHTLGIMLAMCSLATHPLEPQLCAAPDWDCLLLHVYVRRITRDSRRRERFSVLARPLTVNA